MFYLETGSLNPYYNLAFEEYILENLKYGNYLILWQNDNTIVIGQNQNTEEEINEEFVREHQIHVVRRNTGGGAVYHDLGNLNYSIICDKTDAEELNCKKFALPVVRALRIMGLNAEISGRNDILINGKKVSGTAQRIVGDRVLHHGTLLFDSNIAMMEGALRADPEKYKSKSIKSVRSRVGSIRQELKEIGCPMTMPEFRERLLNELLFCQDQDYLERHYWLTETDRKKIMELKEKKYDTWEWNYGRNPKFESVSRKRFQGGTVEICKNVSEGKIGDIRFFGDFLSVESLKPLERALIGCRNNRDEIRDVLQNFNMDLYFGAISLDEIISMI